MTVHTKTARIVLLVSLSLLASAVRPACAGDELLTVAEQSSYRATSRHAEVVAFCERLAKLSPLVRLGELGTSFEGRKLPLVILADPPIATPEEAARSNKLVVFAMGNIHAGEVDGKEALLMLARDLATAKERPLLKDLILVIAPIFNADGNERMAKTNRPGQIGPAEGMGIRANAQGLDLNRDFVKLESPEVRALIRFFNRWNPAITIDMHTTNGSHHRYTLTYEGPRNPAGDARLIATVRDELLPDVGRRLEKHSGFKSFFYGNFSWDRSRWETVPATPRYGLHYVGLRNRIGILSESYSYAPYRDRVLASRDFVLSICEYAAAHKDQLATLLANARSAVVREGRDPKAADEVALRLKTVALDGPVKLLGFVEEQKGGRRIATDKPREYTLQYFGSCEPALSVRRPYAYLFPATHAKVVENLQRHGIDVEELREEVELNVEVYHLGLITRQERVFQKHHEVSVLARARSEPRRVEAGTILVRTAQPLGTLAAYLLEPQSEDGLCTWNFFDDALAEGRDYPVLRLPAPAPLTTGPVRPLPEERTMNKPVSYEAVYGGGRPLSFEGSPVTGLIWLDDDEHFLQVKEGRLYKVRALTGRAEPFHDPEKMARALSALPTISKQNAETLARGVTPMAGFGRRRGGGGQPVFHMNPQRTGALFEVANDLYYCPFDGGKAVRLTKTPAREELVTFSPNGQFVAFVRDHNLYVVDVATQAERQLTTDGSELVSNGKPDWVYGEEIYNYQKTYWWSPDSSHLAFLRIDDSPVPRFTVVDEIPGRQTVENTPYPRSGDPNPRAKLGIVSAAGGAVQWADLANYSETASLVVRAGWTPDSTQLYFYVQDRAQTWLDFCTCGPQGGTPTRLFRETTKAWVDDPGDPTFLKDGSFLLASERTGWKHLYHFDKSGKLLRPVTAGTWEVQGFQRLDEQAGWVYFIGTRDSAIAQNLYRVKLDGSGLERLTASPGTHQVNVSPKAGYFIDTNSSFTTPPQVRLHKADGSPARTLDTNPVYAREEYRFGKEELLQIKTPDGFILEGSVVKPPDFDAKRRYPVWFMTYGGPHAPTMHDTWSGGRVHDQVLAHMGFLVFHCDPRSASGKGACSTWTAYRRLGEQELKDIETAIRWLTSHPYADAKRVGMSGHSYGGFMTAFALTHSKLFAAGIAGAPVTDWRDYDSIYTERYMNTPQENPDGYDATSVVKAAARLHGKLLLAHGLIDDNVHVQNSVQLVQELQRADKDFEIMIYPRSRHGIMERHYRRLMIDFMRRALGKPE
jgi:dipeptidyl aminopeptidase/acylaminoacyl peptidase